MDVGNIIAQLRNQKQLNQREFAQKLGVSNGAVAMWETNKRQPDLEMVKRISAFFNVPVGVLLGTEDFPNQSTEKEKNHLYFFFFFDDLLKKIFTSRLQKTLLDRGLSEEKFCDLVSFDANKCKTYLNGECEPSLEDLKEISQLLNISTDYLLGCTDYRSPDNNHLICDTDIKLSTLSSDELELILNYRDCLPHYKQNIRERANNLSVDSLRENRKESVAADNSSKKTGTDNLGK